MSFPDRAGASAKPGMRSLYENVRAPALGVNGGGVVSL